MTPLEKLEQIRNMFEDIKKQEGLIDYYEMMSHTLGGCDFSSERIDKSRNLDAPFVKWIYKKIDAEAKLKEMKEALNLKIDEAGRILCLLDNQEYTSLLTLRYINNKTWPEIANEMHYSLSSVKRYYRKAIEALDTLKVEPS